MLFLFAGGLPPPVCHLRALFQGYGKEKRDLCNISAIPKARVITGRRSGDGKQSTKQKQMAGGSSLPASPLALRAGREGAVCSLLAATPPDVCPPTPCLGGPSTPTGAHRCAQRRRHCCPVLSSARAPCVFGALFSLHRVHCVLSNPPVAGPFSHFTSRDLLFQVLFSQENKSWFQDLPKHLIKLLQLSSLKLKMSCGQICYHQVIINLLQG